MAESLEIVAPKGQKEALHNQGKPLSLKPNIPAFNVFTRYLTIRSGSYTSDQTRGTTLDERIYSSTVSQLDICHESYYYEC